MVILGIALMVVTYMFASAWYNNLILRVEQDGLKRELEALKNRNKSLERQIEKLKELK